MKSMDFLEIVADWSEKNDVPFDVVRSEASDWYVSLKFRDSRGWFSSHVAVVYPKPGRKGRECPVYMGEWTDKITKRLTKACIEARRQRIIDYNGVDPRKQAA